MLSAEMSNILWMSHPPPLTFPLLDPCVLLRKMYHVHMEGINLMGTADIYACVDYLLKRFHLFTL